MSSNALEIAILNLMVASKKDGLACTVNVFELTNLSNKKVGLLIRLLVAYRKVMKDTIINPLDIYASIINSNGAD